MFNKVDIEVANKTSRNNGAVGKNAIVPRKVREYLEMYCSEATRILDFGAGKTAAHAMALQEDGWAVTAHEFGGNIDPRFHNELALTQIYHVVYASNVLNVQSGIAMTCATISQIANVVIEEGVFFANYPQSPRKSNITVNEMEELLLEQFDTILRVGGTASAPLWMCEK